MRLILIRHARAEKRDARRYPEDDRRPLTKKGRDEQAVLANAMRRMGIAFDRLTTSPLLRARETAEIVAHGVRWTEPPEVAPALGHEFSVKKTIRWLQRYPAETTVACVGHEPDFSELAAALLGMATPAAIDFRKSGVMRIDFDGHPAEGTGTLAYFLSPKEITRLRSE